MAQSSNGKNKSRQGTSGGRNTGSSGRRSSSGASRAPEPISEELMNEIVLICVCAAALFLFLCNFKILGALGNTISNVTFGVFGTPNYIVPIVLAVMIIYGTVNSGNPIAIRKIIAGIVCYLSIAMCFEMIFNMPDKETALSVPDIYEVASTTHLGGGVLGGTLAYISVRYLDVIGTVLLVAVILLVSIIVISDRSFIRTVRDGSEHAYEKGQNGVARAREKRERQRELYEEKRQRKALKDEERRAIKEAREDEKLIKEVSGVTTYNFVSKDEVESDAKDRDDIHEINLTDIDEEFSNRITDVKIHGVDQTKDEAADSLHEIKPAEISDDEEDDFEIKPIRKVDPETVRPEPVIRGVEPEDKQPAPVRKRSGAKRPYKIPPLNLLKKGSGDKSGNIAELKATATKLEEVLQSFGVKVTVTDISKGPSVTRYEMIPETGVKVSKIVSLADDIKLNLAAADIRIEAPIPGKAAIGIEVPNKESSPVLLRDLLEAKEFKDSSSKISFAVGKDLAGKVVVADIAKMPHMLIAGATGSGKSVCINTLIISILYKANPDEVKLIMIDPKVVELSVYNSIPHLLIPVVTDPKKASAALAWAVTEMNDRYQKFADLGVRDLKGYNEKIKNETDESGEPLKPMYQLVVIVDELADMMMVAGKEVEESICRLAQLARAAGIHLILATQRPSVDVITGLIKANMPSRVAFSVSSGVDSRTILDMNGAEKLLGKGDMLFYPQGYTKPARVQGALITDKEVSDVVDFLKNQQLGNNDEDDEINSVINSKIDSMANGSGGQGASSVTGSSDNGNVPDEFFIEAGRVIVESGKCSIGMLQRKFKIGFNRAARIMDALSEYNVVGPDEGTKPRTILMSPEDYERFIENL